MRARRLLASVLWLAPALLWGSEGSPTLNELRFAGGTIRSGPAATLSPPAPEWFAAESGPALSESPRGRRYLLALSPGGLSPTDKESLQAAGVEVLDYVPVHGYRLRVPPAAEHAVRALPFVAWLGEAPAHLKVAPELLRRATLAGAPGPGEAPVGPGERVALRIVLAGDEPPGRTLDVLRGLDVTPAPSGKDGAWRIDATVPAPRLRGILARLASLPEVEAIEPKRPLVPFNQDAVWVHQSFIGPSPQSTPIFDRGIFGCGQIVALADTGQDYGSCYFQDTVNGPPPVSSCSFAPCPAATPAPTRRKDILYYNWSGTPTGDDDFCPAVIGGSGHGTHTSGSIAGDSSPYADCAGFTTPGRNGGDGLAPGAKLVVEEMGDGFEYLNNRGGTLWNLADVAFQNGARIHSNSWGGACYDALGTCQPGCTLPYDSFARDADLAMWSHPDLLVVAAAGNAGQFCPPPLTVGMPGNAKSVLTVGALPHGSAATTPSSFTSPGPVFDGRLKPEIAAQGESTVSAASDADATTSNCGTCSLDGTSMSTPTVAGLAALVREYYVAGFLAAGTRAPAQGFQPSAALLKATLLDGAVALGAQAPLPDFDSGYGRALLAQSLAFPGGAFKMRVVDQRTGVVTGSVVTKAYDVAAGTPFRVTLVWSDYPAALNAATARVNELRLEVIDPSGALWLQKIDPASGLPVMTSNPADAHDDLNTSERFVFPNPVAGRWAVRVVGVDVPMGPQPFALVVHGDLTDCPAPAAPGTPALTTPADHQVGVSWSAVPGAAAYNVYRSLGVCPGGAFVLAAGGVTGTSFTDNGPSGGGLSGGTTYSYVVAAASDATARCESPPSTCAPITPTGDCTLAPQFAGVVGAASPGTSSCRLTLSWSPATPYCAGDVRYNVYRSTDPAFTPGPGNRIARCVVGTTWDDSVALASGATYNYIVRAEDATSGHGGPCRGGDEDANLARAAAVPVGPKSLGTWRDDGGDTVPATMTPAPPWGNDISGGYTAPHVWSAQSDAGVCSDLTSPVLTVGSPGLGPVLSFATRHTLEYDPFGFFGAEGSLGQVEIATGPSFGNWTRLPLSPDYPTLVEFPVNDCDTTQDLDTYFSDTAPYSTYSASLANWGGSDVKLRFHLSGDYLYPSGGWWIDDVQATQVLTPGACTSAAAGPPPIPDAGAVPGQPLRVAPSGPASSGPVTVTWDATRCPATAVNLYWGALANGGGASNGSTFTGGVCGLSPNGSANVALPNNVWFVLAATDGSSTDGSYARDLSGAELIYSGAGAVCPAITSHSTNNGCP
jgi:hypothetical protein